MSLLGPLRKAIRPWMDWPFAFAGVIISGFEESGIKDPRDQARLTRNAGIIAGILLALIYGGLTAVGATTSSLDLGNIARVELLVFIAESLIGSLGLVLLTLAMILACLTTAIGLTASVGSFFERISNGRIPYRISTIASSLFSFAFATMGVDKIVQISSPILTFIYPIAIVMIFLNLFGKQEDLPVFYGGVAGAFIYSVLVVLGVFEPSGIQSFAWIIFSLIGIGVFSLVDWIFK